MRTESLMRRVVGRTRPGIVLALIAASAALIITAPTQAHGCANPVVIGGESRAVVNIRIGGGGRHDDWRRREYAAGVDAGRCAGYQAGFADARARRGYCPSFTICADSYSRHFIDGYGDGFARGYANGYAEGQRDRHGHRRRRAW